MRVHKVWLALALLAPAWTGAGAQAARAAMPDGLSPDRQSLWREVRALNDSMEAAFTRGDLARVARFYADTAILQGSRGPRTTGRAAIDAYWAGIRNPKRWELDVASVGGPRDMPYQVGRSRLVTTDANGTERGSVVDFVLIWQRGPDGVLRIAFDLY